MKKEIDRANAIKVHSKKDLNVLNSKVDVVTLGIANQLQRRNKLKGICQEKIVTDSLDLDFNDRSIQEYLKDEIKNRNLKFYKVKRNFECVHLNEYNQTVRVSTLYNEELRRDIRLTNALNYEDNFITQREINYIKNYNCNLRIVDKIKKIKDKHRYCENCSKIQRNFYDDDGNENKHFYMNGKQYTFHKSCWDCGGKYKDRKITQTTWKNISIDDAFSELNLLKRIDSLFIQDNKLYLIESKNKEISGFSYSDIFTTLIYVDILNISKKYKVHELNFIYNGKITEKLETITNSLESKYNIKINYVGVGNIINYNKIKGHCLSVYKKNNNKNKYDYKYTYEPFPFNEHVKFIINLKSLNCKYEDLHDDFKELKKAWSNIMENKEIDKEIDEHMDNCKMCQAGINRFIELQKDGYTVLEALDTVEAEGYTQCL